MFKEILQIIPKLAPAALNAMEQALSSRFARIAKKFGKGLLASLAGGGGVGIVLGLVDKFLNPLKEVQEAIDRTLQHADDLTTNAKQFGTSSGKLARLQAFGTATGVSPEQLDTLLQKFQTAVAEAQADKTKPSAVRAFVGEKDTAEAFFQFIQSLQKLSTNDQVRVQQDVFGEKQILKMSDFLHADFQALSKKLGPLTAEQLTPRIDKTAGLNDLKDELKARRELEDTFTKGGEITADMVRSQAEREKLNLEKENQQIRSYQNLASLDNSVTQIGNLVTNVVSNLAGMLTKLTNLSENVSKLTNSRAIKGFMKIIGGN